MAMEAAEVADSGGVRDGHRRGMSEKRRKTEEDGRKGR